MEDIEGVKISNLPKATSISGSDIIPGVVGGVTKAVPAALVGQNTEVLTLSEFNQLWEAAP